MGESLQRTPAAGDRTLGLRELGGHGELWHEGKDSVDERGENYR